MSKFKGVSLFSNVGIAETYLNEVGIDIVVANEIDERRARFYQHLYPRAKMIIGDIANRDIFNKIVDACQKEKVDFLIATPPCQGMSIAGKRDEYDERNILIYYAIEIIKRINPKYVLLENVPQALKTKIKLNNEVLYIPDYIKIELKKMYNFADEKLVSAMDYEVPQMRKRNIFLLSRKDMDYIWQMPPKKKKITLRDVIYDLPSVDPLLKEGITETIRLFPNFQKKKEEAMQVSRFHKPPVHSKKHVITMLHTPTGETAFNNEIHYPKKDNGEKVNGHYNTYRRFAWDKPARTITQNNGVISSLCCVHPGKKFLHNDEILYSEPRCLTLYELFIVFSLPKDWDVPAWADDRMIRQVIGEGIPPMLVKNIALELINNTKKQG